MSGDLFTPGEVIARLFCPACGQWWNGRRCDACAERLAAWELLPPGEHAARPARRVELPPPAALVETPAERSGEPFPVS